MPENFENLNCWQKCYDLKGYIRKEILPKLPISEQFDLYSQLLRASRSATANIAEGWGKVSLSGQYKIFLERERFRFRDY